jgi:ABC-type multidrug transport system ATPase subunit
LSGGMKRRVALIRALIQEPAVLFLDEPTTGLDPHARRELWATLADMKSKTTVILTTHYMEEADALSDRILLLNHGRVIEIDTPQALKRAASPHQQYELVLNAPEAQIIQAQLMPMLPEGVKIQEDNPYRLILDACDEALFWQMVATIPAGVLNRAGRVTVDLEAVFLSMGALKAGSA